MDGHTQRMGSPGPAHRFPRPTCRLPDPTAAGPHPTRRLGLEIFPLSKGERLHSRLWTAAVFEGGWCKARPERRETEEDANTWRPQQPDRAGRTTHARQPGHSPGIFVPGSIPPGTRKPAGFRYDSCKKGEYKQHRQPRRAEQSRARQTPDTLSPSPGKARQTPYRFLSLCFKAHGKPAFYSVGKANPDPFSFCGSERLGKPLSSRSSGRTANPPFCPPGGTANPAR